MHKFWLVFKHVYLKNIKSGSWIFMVVFPVLLIMLAVGVGYLASVMENNTKVAVVSDTPIQMKIPDVKVENTTAAKADKLLKSEKVEGVLEIKMTPEVSGKLTMQDDAPDSLKINVTQALSTLKLQVTAAKLKLAPKDVAELVTPATLTSNSVKVDDGKIVTKDESAAALNRILAVTITVVIMIVTMIYGSLVAQEIATEKGTRIMETLLSAVSAKTQFYAKVFAVMGLLLTQVAIYALAIAVSVPFLKQIKMVKQVLEMVDLSALLGVVPLMALLFLLVGTFTYAVLAALAGSLVSSVEQVQMAVMPLSMLGLVGYFLSLTAQAGDSWFVSVASYIPFLNISVMPVRVALNQASFAEGWISLGVAVVFMVLFTMLVAKVYKSNVLVYSDSGLLKGFKRSLQIMKAEKNQK